jgi:hypothetical protein
MKKRGLTYVYRSLKSAEANFLLETKEIIWGENEQTS